MVARIFKGVWVISLLGTVVLFLYGYAGLPEQVLMNDSDPASQVGRDGLFYGTLMLIISFNGAGFALSRLKAGKEPPFDIWLFGMVMLINLFVTIAFQFIALLNSQEKFNYGSIGPIIYGSVTLIVLWSIWWPVYRIFRRIPDKQPV